MTFQSRSWRCLPFFPHPPSRFLAPTQLLIGLLVSSLLFFLFPSPQSEPECTAGPKLVMLYFPAQILGRLPFVPRTQSENPRVARRLCMDSPCFTFPSFRDSFLIIYYPPITTGLVGFSTAPMSFWPPNLCIASHHTNSLASLFASLTLSSWRLNIISSKRLLHNSSSKPDLPVTSCPRTQCFPPCPRLQVLYLSEGWFVSCQAPLLNQDPREAEDPQHLTQLLAPSKHTLSKLIFE